MKKNIITEAIQYHKENNIPYSEPIFRYGSVNFFKYINELRILNESNQVQLDSDAKFFIESDLGKLGIYKGQQVLLDFPMIDNTITEINRSDYAKILKFLRKIKNKITLSLYKTVKETIAIAIMDPYMTADEIINQVSSEYELAIEHIQLTESELKEAEYKGKNVELNSPKRGGSKKYYVYVKSKAGNVKKISFGDTGLSAKIKDSKARKSFAARHKCNTKKDKTKAGYWACNLPRYWDKLGGGSKIGGYW